jgi:hypothetical protein
LLRRRHERQRGERGELLVNNNFRINLGIDCYCSLGNSCDFELSLGNTSETLDLLQIHLRIEDCQSNNIYPPEEDDPANTQ